EPEVVAGTLGDPDQGPRVFREAAPTPTWPGPEELEADASVVAHAEDDLTDIGTHRLTDVGDGVDEGDLGGEEGVRRVLDGLGRSGVGDDDRRLDAFEQGGDTPGRRLILAPDHDAV